MGRGPQDDSPPAWQREMSQTPPARLAIDSANRRKPRRFPASPLTGGCAKIPNSTMLGPPPATRAPKTARIHRLQAKPRSRFRPRPLSRNVFHAGSCAAVAGKFTTLVKLPCANSSRRPLGRRRSPEPLCLPARENPHQDCQRTYLYDLYCTTVDTFFACSQADSHLPRSHPPDVHRSLRFHVDSLQPGSPGLAASAVLGPSFTTGCRGLLHGASQPRSRGFLRLQPLCGIRAQTQQREAR
jgi:hypothetical protein